VVGGDFFTPVDFGLAFALDPAPPFFTEAFFGAVFFTADPLLPFILLVLLLMFVATAITSSVSLPPTMVAMQALSSSSEPESLSWLAGGVLRFLLLVVVVALAATFFAALPLVAREDFDLVPVLVGSLFIMRRNSFPLGPGFGLIT
jgi:hypothetical protein